MIEEEYHHKIVRVLRGLFPETTLYSFDSKAIGDMDTSHDYTIAPDSGERVNHLDLRKAHEALDMSKIPHKINIVNLHYIPLVKKEEIIKKSKKLT